MKLLCKFVSALSAWSVCALLPPQANTETAQSELSVVAARSPLQARPKSQSPPRPAKPGGNTRSSSPRRAVVPRAKTKTGLGSRKPNLNPPGHKVMPAPRIAPAQTKLNRGQQGHAVNHSDAQGYWLDQGRDVKIYVYELKGGPDMSVNAEQAPNYGFEVAFRRLIQQSKAHRVFNPKHADFFYVPVDLCSVRAFWWTLNGKKKHMNALDERVVKRMRGVGPYWDAMPEKHIVPTCRCPSTEPKDDPHNPQLWGRNTTLRLCLETRVTKKKVIEALDTRRSVHVGYYVPHINVSSALTPEPEGRDVLAIFMGATINMYRKQIAAWMNESCKDCALFNLVEHGILPEDYEQQYHDTLRHSRFSLEPPGDTLERMSREGSILSGAIPVILELPYGMPQQSMPWAPILNWADFSVNFTLTEEEAAGNQTFTPRLEKLLRNLVDSGEADRLYHGVVNARSRIKWTEDGALSTVMGMLAWHKAGMPEGLHDTPQPIQSISLSGGKFNAY